MNRRVELPCGAGFSFAARSNDGLLQVLPAAAAVVVVVVVVLLLLPLWRACRSPPSLLPVTHATGMRCTRFD